MKFIFGLLAMAAAAAADDGNNGAQNYDVYDSYAGGRRRCLRLTRTSPTPMPSRVGAPGSMILRQMLIRDRNFYRPGFVNPALNNPLYHNSAQSKLPRPARAAA